MLFFREGGCTWTTRDGSPLPLLPSESQVPLTENPDPPSWRELHRDSIFGTCHGPKGPLKVVALSNVRTAVRAWDKFSNPETIVHHPTGGNIEIKLNAAKAICPQ